MPKATWRDSSCRARWVTRRVTGSGACSSRNPSRFRNVPSPSTDSRNDARAKSGSSSSVASEARPPAPETPERAAAQRRASGEDLHVPRLVGGLHGQHLQHLAEVRMDAAQEAGRHDQRRPARSRPGTSSPGRRPPRSPAADRTGACQSTAVAGSHWLAAAWAYRRGAMSAQTRSFSSRSKRSVGPPASTSAPARGQAPASAPGWSHHVIRQRAARALGADASAGSWAAPRTTHQRPVVDFEAVPLLARPRRAGAPPAPDRGRGRSVARRRAAALSARSTSRWRAAIEPQVLKVDSRWR